MVLTPWLSPGYAVEEHTVDTRDGYRLALHRIPSNASQTRPPVLLLPALLLPSGGFLSGPPEGSQALALAAEGYDVWLPTTRGSSQSRFHSAMTPEACL